MSMFVLVNFGAEELRSNAFITGPGRYRKVEENYRKNSDKSAGRNSSMVNSYDKQPNILISIEITSTKV